jgi:Domain of unknown function (DUF4412)
MYMKRTYIFLMIVIGIVGYSTEGKAQLLKNLANSFTKGLTSKSTGNTANTGNKTDSAANAARDSAMLAGILAGANKPAVMTAADSAAVKDFMMYQYQTRYDIKSKGKDSAFVDTMSSAICENRYTHVDMGMLGMKMTLLGHIGQPRYSMILYPQMKSYKLNVIDTARINSGNGQTFQVTKVGAETVAGYSCVHAKMTITGADKKVVMIEDIWTSASVPGYAQMKQEMSNAHVTVQAMLALQKAGCDGFIVKASGQTTQMSFVMQLVTAERKTFPASMFEIPAGYTAMSGMGLFNGMMQQQAKQK